MDRRMFAKRMERAVVALGMCVSTMMLGACNSETLPSGPSLTGVADRAPALNAPLAPRESAVPREGVAALEGRAAVASALSAPQAVFRVSPAPDADRRIAGGSPLEVTFNACRSSDADDDKMLFTMDADGDGRLDESGTHGGNCRRTFEYTAREGEVRDLVATVCVVDLDTAGQPQRAAECRNYYVRVVGPRPAAPAGGAACGVPAPGATGWVATEIAEDIDDPFICTCAADGTVLSLLSFATTCADNGGKAFVQDEQAPFACGCNVEDSGDSRNE
jgi:hypothetical protein